MPPKRGDRRGEREREELGHHHVDPQRRRRPFVGAHGDQSTAAAATSHVGDHHDRQHRHDQHEDPVALRVVDRPDVVAEQVGIPDLCALHAAGVVAVLEQHQLDGGSQAERDDRQVDPPGSHRREAEDQAERHRGGDAGQQPEQERDVEHGDQAARRRTRRSRRSSTARGRAVRRTRSAPRSTAGRSPPPTTR